MTAVDILQQFILDVNQHFDVTVASICGNESRINQDYGTSKRVVSDSFDFIIHASLQRLFSNSPTVEVLEMLDPNSCLVEVAGNNLLMVHGHMAGLANTAKMEKAVQAKIAQYSDMGIKVDYVICGHIHSAYVSDWMGRSSGLPGGNGYSQDGLALRSRSSQNGYIAKEGGKGFHGIKVDLQTLTMGAKPYKFQQEFVAHRTTKELQNTMVIQAVVV